MVESRVRLAAKHLEESGCDCGYPAAASLDIERLALALMSENLARVARVNGGWEWWATGPDEFAKAVAAEYARLSSEKKLGGSRHGVES